MEEFIITEDHIKLANRMFVRWDDSAYNGAPTVDIKRPYGNSDCYFDVIEILGWDSNKCPRCGELLDENLKEEALKIHKQMATALQIWLCIGSICCGHFFKKDECNSLSWTFLGH